MAPTKTSDSFDALLMRWIEDAADSAINRRMDELVSAVLERLRATTSHGQARETTETFGVAMFRAKAAAYLGLSPATLDALVRKGLVTPTTLDGIEQRVYLRTELDRYVAERQRGN